MKNYIVISRCEDEPGIYRYTQQQLLTALAPEGDLHGYQILDRIPDADLQYFPASSVLIIEGTIIVPKPKKVVTEFEL